MARGGIFQFDQVAVSLAGDLFGLYSGTAAFGRGLRLLRCVLTATDVTIPTSQMLAVQIKTFGAGSTVTAGTGGTAATLQKIDPGDPAFTWTCRVNDTTTSASQASGTTNIVYDGSFHAYNGFDESFAVDGANPKGFQPVAIGVAAAGSANSAAIIVHLMNAPTGTIHLSGTVWVEEFG